MRTHDNAINGQANAYLISSTYLRTGGSLASESSSGNCNFRKQEIISMSMKQEIKSKDLNESSDTKENISSAFVALPKLPPLTGTSRKRPFPAESKDQNDAPKSKIPKKKPTDQDLALNYFIKQLANELLDRRLTIVQQPRHRLAQLEAACKRQFPAFNDRQIRLKIRAQLKLYRRNLKKAEERKLAKPISFNPQSGQFEKLSLPIVGQNRSCFPGNSNAISMAHRALANERKQELMPLKPLNNLQNMGITLNPIIMSKPLTENASGSCSVGETNPKPLLISSTPNRMLSNPQSVFSMPSPVKIPQTNSSPSDLNSLKSLLESMKIPNISEPSSNFADSVMLNISDFGPQPSQIPESQQLNQSWSPAISDPSCIIANCLRIAANFLLQSATLFEPKNPTIASSDQSALQLIANPILGSDLPPIPLPLGFPNNSVPNPPSLVCSLPSQISSKATIYTNTATTANSNGKKNIN
ncbi:hypothetical protein ACTXT7_008751 [Hymenolepis weldensis]